MDEKKLREKLFDDMLVAALEEYAAQQERELDEIMAHAEPHQFSPEFERKMSRMFRRYKAKERVKRFVRVGTKAAVIVFACLSVSALVVFNVDALRVPVLNFFLEVEDQFTSVRIDSSHNASVPVEFERYLPKYLPDGFVLSRTIAEERNCTFIFENGDQNFLFDVFFEPQFLAFDTEDAVVTETKINGYQTYISVKKNRIIIEMFNEKISFGLSADLSQISQEDAVKIMQSIES